jgi:nucleoid DNA-binding protein
MTNQKLIKDVAKLEGITKAAAGRIVEFIGRAIIADLLLDGKSQYPALGIFSLVTRAPKACINPRNGASVGIKPAYKTVKFKPYKAVKEQVNQA